MMNKRVNKLAEKARIGKLVHIGGGDWDWYAPEAQLFVELLISEIEQMVETDVPVSDQCKEGRRSLYRYIKRVFGSSDE